MVSQFLQMRKQIISIAFLVSAGFHISAGAQVQNSPDLVLGTFNTAWLMDQSLHKRWVEACSSIGWPAGESVTPAEAKKMAGLPYCDVHNGLIFPPDKCSLSTAERMVRPQLDDKGCRESADLMSWQKFQGKLTGLNVMIGQLQAKNGVNVIAFQEVSSTEALMQILPPGWNAKTSADFKNSPDIPQHVGLAWNEAAGVTVGDFDLLNELSTVGSRPLRPGLLARVNVRGTPTEILVVHLKSGCAAANTKISAPASDYAKKNCPDLARQVPILENWIDARVGKPYIIIGDFNRKLTMEKATLPDTGARPDPKYTQLFPELNDNDPLGSKVWLARAPRTADGKSVVLCINGHPDIDHIIVSDALAKKLPTSGRLVMNALELPVNSPTMSAVSDHCPHFTAL